MSVSFEVGTEHQTSHVEVGRGVADPFDLPARLSRTKAAVLHQPATESVARRVADDLEGTEVVVIELPDRDQAKRWEVVADIHLRLARFELGRHDTVVGIGGGAVTDLAGFVAATWLRGVEACYLPTTLLAAVDAAIGGKTGINVAGKNLVGAFWHPSYVAIDLDILDALPTDLKLEGFAEAVKAGFVGDPALVEIFAIDGAGASLDEIVPAAIAVKAAVVSSDFREQGRRAILNFGHTLGHALEVHLGMTHGHAIAVGMVAEAAVSEARFGIELPVAEIVAKIGLPVRAPADVEQILDLVALDKKRDQRGVRMVLLNGIGNAEVHHVTVDEIRHGMARIG